MNKNYIATVIRKAFISSLANYVNPGDWFNNNIFADNETWFPIVWINFEWQPDRFEQGVDGCRGQYSFW